MAKPKLTALPATLFLVGLGLSLHYGYAWWRLPVYSEQDIAASVELNLAMDLRRQSRDAGPNHAALEPLRDKVDQELRAEIARERLDVQRGFVAGAIALLLSLGQMLWLRHLSTRS